MISVLHQNASTSRILGTSLQGLISSITYSWTRNKFHQSIGKSTPANSKFVFVFIFVTGADDCWGQRLNQTTNNWHPWELISNVLVQNCQTATAINHLAIFGNLRPLNSKVLRWKWRYIPRYSTILHKNRGSSTSLSS